MVHSTYFKGTGDILKLSVSDGTKQHVRSNFTPFRHQTGKYMWIQKTNFMMTEYAN